MKEDISIVLASTKMMYKAEQIMQETYIEMANESRIRKANLSKEIKELEKKISDESVSNK